MKKILLAVFVLATASVQAQYVKATFEENSLGWTEISDKKGEAVIKEGVLHLEAHNARGVHEKWYSQPIRIESHCFSTLDVSENFEIKVDMTAGRSGRGYIGLMLDYEDSSNFLAFIFNKRSAFLLRFVNGSSRAIAYSPMNLKYDYGDKVSVSVKNTYKEVQFYVDNIQAVKVRNYPLSHSGFGLFVWDQQIVDVNSVEFIQ